MDRLEATEALVRRLDREPVIANLGLASGDLYAAGDRDANFYTWGSMGLASSMGLGVALAAPDRKVIVLDGDGSILMNLGSLATIARLRPANLVHIIWDNAQWALTGGQPTATATGTDLASVARGAGIPRVAAPSNLEEFEQIVDQALTEDGPWCIVVRVEEEGKRSPVPRMEPEMVLLRFRATLS